MPKVRGEPLRAVVPTVGLMSAIVTAFSARGDVHRVHFIREVGHVELQVGVFQTGNSGQVDAGVEIDGRVGRYDFVVDVRCEALVNILRPAGRTTGSRSCPNPREACASTPAFRRQLCLWSG